MKYHISKTVNCPFSEALDKAALELKKEGFGVLTEIDVRATMKKKLDVDFRNYKILGACNPNFAHRALAAEDKVGVLLPCNVVVQEHADGRVEVSALAPAGLMKAVGNPALDELADQVEAALKRVIESI
ncbi:MAG: hypothetical protein A3F83_04710 [Candidatus Glassbacteria bacterium RIFCSPLOWO2_12_FULL_58_11]|uniref:DUF302 domain-containing protein n=1 Tax=Candidatus Glassbacteria bacterium RIFCSPLOWO2_12_FULL_58_11 TaxID=1817867 RepID=A0A1F5YNL7_9BACT|nr:MAG: hypothetical protein A3F83_04710 [Candidatus Glassbacteria bacterium RIFCSPLOWO2_12_FULL_58_11]